MIQLFNALFCLYLCLLHLFSYEIGRAGSVENYQPEAPHMDPGAKALRFKPINKLKQAAG